MPSRREAATIRLSTSSSGKAGCGRPPRNDKIPCRSFAHSVRPRTARRRSPRAALRFAIAPADVEAGKIAHGERPHRKAEFGQCAVDLMRQGALEQQALGLDRAGAQHAVADKAVAISNHHRHLAEFAAERHGGGHHVRRGGLAAHDFQKPHDVGGAEEMRAEHRGWPLRHGARWHRCRDKMCWMPGWRLRWRDDRGRRTLSS